MSRTSEMIIKLLKLSKMKEKLAKGSGTTFEEAVSYNRKHPYIMPKDKKAIYEELTVKTGFGDYPCLKISQNNSSPAHAVLFTWGGGGLLNAWKSQLSMAIKLGRDACVPVYYPIYPLATEHSLMDTLEMIAETYGMLTKEFKPDNITVIGVSSGGSQALDLITYINEYRPEIPKPGNVICISPGCVPITEEEKRRMEALAPQDAMVSASFVYSFEDISNRWEKYPDWVQHPTVGNYTGLKKIRFYYAANETLAFAVDSFRENMTGQGVDVSFYLRDRMFHTFAIFPICKEGKEAYQDVLKNLK